MLRPLSGHALARIPKLGNHSHFQKPQRMGTDDKCISPPLYTHTHTHTHTLACACARACMCVRARTCVSVCVCVCVCVSVHTHTYTHTHAVLRHTHTHTHTQYCMQHVYIQHMGRDDQNACGSVYSNYTAHVNIPQHTSADVRCIYIC